MTITSDQAVLEKRLMVLRNRFAIIEYLQYQGMNWVNVVMSGNDNPYFSRDSYIKLYNGENN